MTDITGTDDADDIHGGAGNDNIRGLGGDDTLGGRDGDDRIEGGAGSDTLYGGAGRDFLFSDGYPTLPDLVPDTLIGGRGDNYYYAGYNDTVVGGEDYDWLMLDWNGLAKGLTGVLRFDLQNGSGTFSSIDNVWWTLTGRADHVRIGDDLDAIVTRIDGGTGNDVFRGTRDGLEIRGGAGKNTMIVGAAALDFDGNGGIDTIDYSHVDGGIQVERNNESVIHRMSGGVEITDSAYGYERLVGSGFADLIEGKDGIFDYDGGDDRWYYTGYGDDLLRGGDGNDTIHGNGGYDRIAGGAGDDVIDGGQNRDIMAGGTGADHFVFQSITGKAWDYKYPDSGGPYRDPDLITDFSHAEGDRIDLSVFDANNLTDGRQAPIFLGAGAPTGQAGELWYTVGRHDLFLHLDNDGDGRSDFDVQLKGVDTLTVADLIL